MEEWRKGRKGYRTRKRREHPWLRPIASADGGLARWTSQNYGLLARESRATTRETLQLLRQVDLRSPPDTSVKIDRLTSFERSFSLFFLKSLPDTPSDRYQGGVFSSILFSFLLALFP